MKFNTFVFFDLEGTGLPGPGNTPRITEISLVAVHRHSLMGSDSTEDGSPRVMAKLNECVCPRKPISAYVTQLTGLNNDQLERQKDFDEDLVEQIHGFIRRRERPVCLIAHNGLNYDFGLLKSELHSIGKDLPGDVYVADSLVMFKEIDELEIKGTNCETPGCPDLQPTKTSSTAHTNERKKNPSSVKRKLFPTSDEESRQFDCDMKQVKYTKDEGTDCVGKQFWEELRSGQSLEDDLLCTIDMPQDYTDQKTSADVNALKTNSSPKVSDLNVNKEPEEIRNDTLSYANHASTSKKTDRTPPKLSYKLLEVHKRIIGYKPANLHKAEDDALALLRIFYNKPQVFCDWVDDNAKLFTDIEPFYVNQRSPLPPGVFPYNCPHNNSSNNI